jgi:cobalt-zinc-cadmium efflux system protein
VAAVIFYEAYRRLKAPPFVDSELVIAVGIVALLINGGTALIVRRGGEHDLNVRAVFVHLLGDALSSGGAIAAGILIYFTGAHWLDPAASLLTGVLIVYTAWGILRETVEILLEATPRDLDLDSMLQEMLKIKGVLGIHDVHVWSVAKHLRAMSAHVHTEDIPISAGTRIQAELSQLAARRYNISHATLQLESVLCDLDARYCDI